MRSCVGSSPAKKRYERDVIRWMGGYVVVLLLSAWMVKHGAAANGWAVYFWSVLPSVPVLGVMWRMGLYLREEKDEYLRWLTMQSILVGTAVLLSVVLVSDFLRAFAHVGALPPFAAYLIFAGGMAATQARQWLQNRTTTDG